MCAVCVCVKGKAWPGLGGGSVALSMFCFGKRLIQKVLRDGEKEKSAKPKSASRIKHEKRNQQDTLPNIVCNAGVRPARLHCCVSGHWRHRGVLCSDRRQGALYRFVN